MDTRTETTNVGRMLIDTEKERQLFLACDIVYHVNMAGHGVWA